MYFMGIDPGIDGAIALWMPGSEMTPPPGASALPDHLHVIDMPVLKTEVSGKERRVLDRAGLREWIGRTLDLYGMPKRIVMERVGQMPGQSGMFTFGYGCGCVVMALECAGLTVDTVTSQTWKRDLKVPREKDRAMARAADLFPQHATSFHVPHAKVHGKTVARPDRAEAAMLAMWGQRFGT